MSIFVENENRQNWRPTVEPQPDSGQFRYPLYKRFWTMLYCRMVFCDERYLETKEKALEFHKKEKENLLLVEGTMPNCVVNIRSGLGTLT